MSLNDSQFRQANARYKVANGYKDVKPDPLDSHSTPVAEVPIGNGHNWPRGYSPERFKQVSETIGNSIRPSAFGATMGKRFEHPAVTKNRILQSVARSTIPQQHLQDFADFGGNFLHHPDNNGAGGEFDGGTIILNTINQRLHGHKDVMNEVTNHELGHARDYLTSNNPMMGDIPEDVQYTSENAGASWPAPPKEEGLAEGYSMRHSRITKNVSRKYPELHDAEQGYQTKGFTGDSSLKTTVAQTRFKRARKQAFDGTALA